MNYTIPILLIFVIYILIRRVQRGLHGRQFKIVRLFSLPLIYLLLLLFFLAVFMDDIYYLTIIIGLIFAGITPGYVYGDHVSFFMKDNLLYYKRSPYILVTWVVTFMGRIILEIVYPYNITADFIVDALLAVTLGLIMGESVKTYYKYREYINDKNSVMGF